MEQLTELIYSDDRTGAFKLYVYERNSPYHRGGVWFEKRPKYPDEEITTAEAESRFDVAMSEGREIRITNGQDFLVLHAKDGRMIYPETAEAFWKDVR